MPTALTLMNRALGALGVVDQGGVTPTDAQSDVLGILNAMIDAWSIDTLTIYQIAQVQKTLTAGTGSYTVYSGGSINIARPNDVASTSFVRLNGTDFPLAKVTREQYSVLGDKSSAGLPEVMYFDAIVPQSILYLYPVPDQAYVLYLDYWQSLTSFPDVSTTNVTLPPGYERALWTNLAMECLPTYPSVDQRGIGRLAAMAMTSKANIQRRNVRVPILKTPNFGQYDAVIDR